MPDKKITQSHIHSSKNNGVYVLLGLYATTLLMMVAFSALALKLFAPAPTVDPEVLRRAVDSTMGIAIPIYIDGTLQAELPGRISGTLTASVPTQTPNPPTPTTPPVPCDLAGFISDVTIPDGTRLSAAAAFTKVWLVRNVGTCIWKEDYALVFAGGELMAGQSPLTIGKTLAPGDTLEISVNLVAPTTGGVYASSWFIRNSDGINFGLAPDNGPLSLRIVVGSHQLIALDFTEKTCFATWSSSFGSVKCPNTDDYINGSVNPVETTIVENGFEFDSPSLEVIPNEGENGTVIGKFNLLQIQKNDSFNAIIGCGNSQPDCDLVFELKYDPGDHNLVTLGRWVEYSDGSLQKVIVDLSPLEGKTVSLVLVVSSANGTARENKGVWVSPVIFRTVK